jgi:hypothetical protein
MKSMFYQPADFLALSESSAVRKSIQHSSTSLAETIRKLVGRWLQSYRPLEQDTTQYKAHKDICTYEATSTQLTGNRIEVISCILYNVKTLVQTMINFWGYRKTNSFRLMTIKADYGAAVLQPMDGIIVSASEAESGLGIVQSVEVDVNNHEVTLVVWYPIIVGG